MKLIILLHFIAIIYVNHAQERILNGDIATEVIPYQVSLRNLNDNETHFCGGAIISKNLIVTAAHCLKGSPEDTIAVVGTLFLSSGGTRYNISKFMKHPEYDDMTYKNDIALIKTADPIEFDDNVKAIDLYTDDVPKSSELLVSGWGAYNITNNREGDVEMDLIKAFVKPWEKHNITFTGPSEYLKTLNVYSISHFLCTKIYKYTSTFIYTSNLCTIGPLMEGTCDGDDGGPLVYKNRLAGVLSRSSKLCILGEPAIYSKIAAHIVWIDYKMKKNE